MEETAKFKDVQIELPEPLEGCESLSAVIGFPEWWPTGARIAVVALIDYERLTQSIHINFIGTQQPDKVDLARARARDNARHIPAAFAGQEAHIQAANAGRRPV